MSARIFLNYRRSDSQGFAGWLRSDLAARFGADHVFMDVVGIEPGLDFVEEINRQVAECDLFLAMIGPAWMTPRLDQPDDYVRLEVEAALARGIRVVPVLVGGATMPQADQLPPSLAPLARRNAVTLTGPGWQDEVRRLGDVIERTARAAPAPAAPAPKRPKQAVAEEVDPGHPVEGLAFSPDGRRIAAAGAGFVTISPVSRGAPLASSGYEASLVYSLTYSPDGRFVATTHNDGTARVWDTGTGDLAQVVKRGKRVYDVAFSPDGTLLATAHDDRTARIWEIESGLEHAPLRHDNVVYAVAFPDDAALLHTATGEAGRAPLGGSARVWDHWNASVVDEYGYGGADAFFTGARFSADGARLAVTTSEYVAVVFDGGAPIEEIPGVAYGQTVAFGPGDSLAVAWTAGGATAYRPDGSEMRLGGDDPVRALALDATGSLAATAGESGPIRLWALS